MAKEATYLVLAPEGITTGAGHHPTGTKVYDSDLDGSGPKLQQIGLIVRTAEDEEPPARRSRPGVPGWNEVGVTNSPADTEPGDDSALPETNLANRAALTPDVLADVADPTDLHGDAEAAAVVALPAPAVLRFTRQHPERLQDVMTAELSRARPRQSVVQALRDQSEAAAPPPAKKAAPKKAAAKKAAARKG